MKEKLIRKVIREEIKRKKTKTSKLVQEGFYGDTEIEKIINLLEYDDFEHFFSDNPGAQDLVIGWINQVPEFREALKGTEFEV